MAAPLDNTPTSNGPVNGSQATVSSPVDKGPADFDPESHAAKANKEYLDRMEANHDAEIRRMQEDSEARTNSLREEINSMRDEIAAAKAAPPPQTTSTVNLEDKYRLEQDEQENYGDMLGTIDKRAALYAEKAHNAAFDKASRLFATERDQLRAEIEGLKDMVNKANQGVSQNFEASARARAGNYGLDLDALETEEAWNTLMAQPISPVNNMTYSEYIKAAVAAQNMQGLESVFKYYSQEFRRPTGPSLTGLPGSGQARQDTYTDQTPSPQNGNEIMVSLEALEGRREKLRDDISRRRISIDEYKGKILEIDNEVMALRKQMT